MVPLDVKIYQFYRGKKKSIATIVTASFMQAEKGKTVQKIVNEKITIFDPFTGKMRVMR